jgi:protein-glutamine gamma-glutamyltransferase
MRYALQLPNGGNPSARALAARLRDEYADPRARVGAMLRHFREEEFFYTLSPPLLGEDSVDEFLFGTRRGFCEHYAGAFAFVMRAAGVPTRVVLGYQGGELNPIGDYLIVRQSDAHAWTEVHFDDVGWVRVDPTAAVSPDRIEFGAGGMAVLDGRDRGPLGELAWVNRLRLQWDDLNNRWNQFVLGYDRERQRELLEGFGFQDAGYRTLVVLLVISLALVMGTLGLWLFWQARPARVRDPAVRLYLKLQRLLERRGVLPRRPDEGPRDYAARAVATDPALARPVNAFIDAFVQYRYHAQPSAAELAAMKAALAALKG